MRGIREMTFFCSASAAGRIRRAAWVGMIARFGGADDENFDHMMVRKDILMVTGMTDATQKGGGEK